MKTPSRRRLRWVEGQPMAVAVHLQSGSKIHRRISNAPV